MPYRLLVIEDDPALAQAIVGHLTKGDNRAIQWDVTVADSISGARQILSESSQEPHVILADLGLPDGNVLDHLEQWQEDLDSAEWLFAVDEAANIDSRLESLAYDMLQKPFDWPRLERALQVALRSTLTLRRLKHYTTQETSRYPFDAYVGSSPAVAKLKAMLKQLAEVPISTIIIHGETGTGKGLVARIIHHNGLHRDGPLVELNCAALPRELLESQLFGHESGAFTGAKQRVRGLFEQADGGTLFLDEIGDMDIELQAKLLKAIEDGRIRRLGSEKEISVNVQVLAATGIDLEQAIADGEFRDDLYHRLSVFSVELPPLRERKQDIIELTPKIIAEYNQKANKNVTCVPDDAWDKLLNYDWPGNIRELRNVIERCVLLSRDDTLPTQWLQIETTQSSATQQNDSATLENKDVTIEADTLGDAKSLHIPLDGSLSLDAIEELIIKTALTSCGNNISQAAKVLGISRETMRYRKKKFNL